MNYNGLNKVEKGFTLAEVLITLGIIGVVAAMTMPALINNFQKKALFEQFKVAYSLIQQELVKTQADWGYCPDCYYWLKNPYGSLVCASRDKYGSCLRYEMPDGSPVPGDYNGSFGDCVDFHNEIPKQFRVVKICQGQAYKKGCIADFKGIDSVRMANDDEMSAEEANSLTRGCGNFRKASIQNNLTAYVLANGITIIPYSAHGWPIWLVDINGKKAPNKWGHDLFTFQLKGAPGVAMRITGGACEAIEKGGTSTSRMIQNIHKK